jgi:hypothetical protein
VVRNAVLQTVRRSSILRGFTGGALYPLRGRVDDGQWPSF